MTYENAEDAKMRKAAAIDAAREALRLGEAEGVERPQLFLRAARAALQFVDEREAGLIAARLVGALSDEEME